MEFLFELFPLILFVAFLVKTDIYIATGVLMAAVLVQLLVSKLRGKPINKMTLVATALLFVFGGLTLLLQNETFIKWKPTAVYWLFAAVFLGSQYIGEKTLAQRFYQAVFEQAMEGEIRFSKAVWTRLNLAWVGFFVVAGLANIVVAPEIDPLGFGFSEDTWVDFKLFGLMGMTLAFIVATIAYLYKHLPKEDTPSK